MRDLDELNFTESQMSGRNTFRSEVGGFLARGSSKAGRRTWREDEGKPGSEGLEYWTQRKLQEGNNNKRK